MNRVECNSAKRTSVHFQEIRLRLEAGIILSICAGVLAMLMLLSPLTHPAYASEGGASSYTPGAQGEFGMNYYPPGLYFRENIVYTEGKLSNSPVKILPPDQGSVALYAKLDSKVWFDLLQVLYSSNLNILGGRYFASLNIPVGITQKLNAKAYIPASPESGIVGKDDTTTTGLGDIQAVPLGIVWDVNDLHFLAAQNLVLDTGRYDVNKANNMGRNYFSYDEIAGFTWLDQKGGHEISFMAGYMINTKNQATQYKTGNEFHVDYTLAQYLSKQLGFGIVGYYYKQMTDDKSNTLDQINAFDKSLGPLAGVSAPGGYKSKGSAVGPAVMFTPNIGGKDVNLIVKWLHEYSMTNRLEGKWVWFSGVVKF